jgi:sugar lactone lactonase YvrE
VLLVAVLAAIAGAFTLMLMRRPEAGIAASAFLLAFLGPLSVRAAAVAAYEHGDIPVEMLVYTQTSPALHHVDEMVAQYAKESGQGLDTPITVDTSQAFAWPWVWYLRDYHKVSWVDLSTYRSNPQLVQALPAHGILLADLANASIGQQRPDIYAPGLRYEHRWWFPEGSDPRPAEPAAGLASAVPAYAGEGYRSLTTSHLFDWLHDGSHLKAWADYFMHRDPGEKLGSVDAMAFFPVDWRGAGGAVTAQPPVEPRTGADGRLVTGEPGSGKGQFERPAGMAIDAAGNVYVADSLNNRVQKIGPDGRVSAVLTGTPPFREPWGVAVDKDGNLYVADTWNHRIQKYDKNLKVLTMWGGPAGDPNAAGFTPLELYGPRSIAIDGDSNLWVTDTGHSRLIKYAPDGRPLATLGAMGTGPGQFQEPVAVAIAPGGDLLVTDTWNGRVQRFDRDGAYKSEFRVDGWTDRGTEDKPYLAVAADGTIYLTVPDTGAVLTYSADGRLLGPAGTLDGGSARANPIGLAIDPSGRLWVSDGANATITRLPGR